MSRIVAIDYTNYRGERSARIIEPGSIRFGSTEFHAEPQWLLSAWDVAKSAERTFAMRDIHRWTTGDDALALMQSTAPTSAAGATKPDELTSSPEPAPALRAAEWVKRGLELADDFALKHALHVQGRATFAAVADAREAMEAHLSRASGLLPVAREGLSEDRIIEIFDRSSYHRNTNWTVDFARAIEAAHGIAPASGDAPGEAK